MPSDISLRLFGIWLAVGFATGFGFAAGTYVFGRLVAIF